MAEATTEASLEAEPVSNIPEDDGDSALGWDESVQSASTSLRSSILGYKFENGRRYHAYREGAYAFPNDEQEQSRLDLLHHVYLLALGGELTMAPLSEDIRRVLDFGTGTGIWAIDFADEHPNAEVIGTDLSPIQPSWVPNNCRFLVDDVESDWNYSSAEAFDLIHGRSMAGGIADWKLLLERILGSLKPGGILEMQEFEAAFFAMGGELGDVAPSMRQWELLVNQAGDKFGKKMNMAPELKQLMEECGFVDLNERVVQVPIGPWAKGEQVKELGRFQREHVLDGVDAYGAFFTRLLGWSDDEQNVLLAKLKREVRDPKLKLYTKFRFIYGSKPSS